MSTRSVRFPVLWGLGQALVPLLLLSALVWTASHAMTVSWSWIPRKAGAAAAPTGALRIPVEGITAADLSDTFLAPRSGGRTHHAIDIAAPEGTPVLAAADGVILKQTRERLGGRAVYQYTADSSHVLYYAHLSRVAGHVAPGTRVAAGERIGTVGDTGNAAPGAYHLHFAVWAQEDAAPPWADRPVNPYPLLGGR
jgi:murein DD-endopeptidase MepM/ murein hydrolase activator NlpD